VFGERQDSFNVEFVESRVIHLNLSDGQTFSKIFLLFFIGPLIDRPVKDEHLIETAMDAHGRRFRQRAARNGQLSPGVAPHRSRRSLIHCFGLIISAIHSRLDRGVAAKNRRRTTLTSITVTRRITSPLGVVEPAPGPGASQT
jgi:hypothetical protein